MSQLGTNTIVVNGISLTKIGNIVFATASSWIPYNASEVIIPEGYRPRNNAYISGFIQDISNNALILISSSGAITGVINNPSWAYIDNGSAVFNGFWLV